MQRPLRLGLVGVGSNAANHHLPAYRQIPGVAVVACCASSRGRAEAGAARLGIPAAYGDVATMVRVGRLDAVCVCSTNDAHHRNTLDALEAGAHVLCEKPMALDPHQAQEMAAAAGRSGRVAMVAFSYRFVPAARLAQELIAGGALGEILTLQATYVSAYLADLSAPVEKPWKLRRAQGGGVLGDLGSHLVDLTGWWLGAARRAAGTLHAVAPKRRLPDGSVLDVDADDASAFTLEFACGAVGSYFVTKYATGRANFQRVEVYGREGALYYSAERPAELDVCLGPEARAARRWTTMAVPPRFGDAGASDGVEAFRLAQARAFVGAIQGQGPIEPSFADGVACQEILDAVAASAGRGGWVAVQGVEGDGVAVAGDRHSRGGGRPCNAC